MERLKAKPLNELKDNYTGVFVFLETKGNVNHEELGYMNMFLSACMVIHDPYNDSKSLEAAYSFVQELQEKAGRDQEDLASK